MIRNRRGFALLAAIWLVVAIATVALQFALDARERRLLGINTAERGKGRAAALGALNASQAALEQSLRQGPGTGNARVALLRGADPWLDADSIFSGVIFVDSIPVDVAALDLGTQLNINSMGEQQLRTFFSFALRDFATADKIAQAVLDWRDADSIPRSNGAERDDYIRDGRLALPTNQTFREVSDILNVDGMTPEIYARVSPYLTTRGSGVINVNSADTVVLRAVPGMTDEMLANILTQRSMGRRISNLSNVMPRRAGVPNIPGLPGGLGGQVNGMTVDVSELQLTLTAYVGPQQLPVRLNAIIQRQGTNSRITWRQW
jgi:general secretion pathway protein K